VRLPVPFLLFSRLSYLATIASPSFSTTTTTTIIINP
jgi:hypothetical protein